VVGRRETIEREKGRDCLKSRIRETCGHKKHCVTYRGGGERLGERLTAKEVLLSKRKKPAQAAVAHPTLKRLMLGW